MFCRAVVCRGERQSALMMVSLTQAAFHCAGVKGPVADTESKSARAGHQHAGCSGLFNQQLLVMYATVSLQVSASTFSGFHWLCTYAAVVPGKAACHEGVELKMRSWEGKVDLLCM